MSKRKTHPTPPAPIDVLSLRTQGTVYLTSQDRTRRVNNPTQIVTEAGQLKWKDTASQAAVYTDEGEAQPAGSEPMMQDAWTDEAFTVDADGVTFTVTEVDADGNQISNDLLPYSLDDMSTTVKNAWVKAQRGVLKAIRKIEHNLE